MSGENGEREQPLVTWGRVEGTTWPVPLGLDWRLRYGAPLDRTEALSTASVVHAYGYLIDPSLPQYQAIAALKRARKAAKSSLPAPPVSSVLPREGKEATR